MTKKLGFFLNVILMNVVLSLGMSIAATLLHSSFSWMFFLDWLIAFCVTVLMSLIIPLQKISNAFASLFKLKDKPVAQCLVGTILVNVIATLIMSIAMTTWATRFHFPDCILGAIFDFPILYPISYVLSVSQLLIYNVWLPRKLAKGNEQVSEATE